MKKEEGKYLFSSKTTRKVIKFVDSFFKKMGANIYTRNKHQKPLELQQPPKILKQELTNP